MCIILTCEMDKRPTFDLIQTCFITNGDGAGLMWCEDGMVQTAKGFMDEYSLYEAIEDIPTDTPLAIHMRIATSGGISVGTCHPFPVCHDLEALHAPYVECDAALMHNGVIRDIVTNDALGISDTVFFTATTVCDLYRHYGAVTSAMKRRMRKEAPSNRFAILTSDGTLSRIGDGWETVTDGIHASNGSWRFDYRWYRYTSHTSTSRWYDWYDMDDDMDDDMDTDAPSLALLDVMDRWCGDCFYRRECERRGPQCFDVDDDDLEGVLI